MCTCVCGLVGVSCVCRMVNVLIRQFNHQWKHQTHSSDGKWKELNSPVALLQQASLAGSALRKPSWVYWLAANVNVLVCLQCSYWKASVSVCMCVCVCAYVCVIVPAVQVIT